MLYYAAFKMLILPPGLFVLTGGIGWWLWKRRPKTARWLVGLTLLSLYLMSIRLVSDPFADAVAYDFAPLTKNDGTQAIVVLAGGHREYAPEYGGLTVSRHTLERIRYAAKIQQEFDLPILASGGPSRPKFPSHAEMMQSTLIEEFGADVPWAEKTSKTTWQNAQNTAQILFAEDIRRIYLVTNALHMHRSVVAFEAAGFEVIPAPTVFYGPVHFETFPLTIIPSMRYFEQSRHALYEAVGRIKYFMAKW